MGKNNKTKRKGLLTKGIATLLLSVVISTGTGCSSNNGFKNIPSSRIPISCSECSNSKYYKINDLKSYLKQFFSKRMTEEMSSAIDLISDNLEGLLGGNSLYVIKENYIVENMLVFYEGNDTTINEDYTLTISPLEDGYDIRYVDNDKYHTVYSYSIDYKNGVRVTRTTEDNGVTLISTINECVQHNKIDFSTGAHKILFNSNGKKLMLELNGCKVRFVIMDVNNNITDEEVITISQKLYNQMQMSISFACENESVSSFIESNRKLILDLLEKIDTNHQKYEKFYFNFIINKTENSYVKGNIESGLTYKDYGKYVEIDVAKFIEKFCLIVDESERTRISNIIYFLKGQKVYLEKDILDDIAINGIDSLLKREYFELFFDDGASFVRIYSSKYSQNQQKVESVTDDKWYDEKIVIYGNRYLGNKCYYPVIDIDKMMELFIGKEFINESKVQERISFMKKGLEKIDNVVIWIPFDQNHQVMTSEYENKISVYLKLTSEIIISDSELFRTLCVELDRKREDNNFLFYIRTDIKDAFWESSELYISWDDEGPSTFIKSNKCRGRYREIINGGATEKHTSKYIQFTGTNYRYTIHLLKSCINPHGHDETNHSWEYYIKFVYDKNNYEFVVSSDTTISKEEYDKLVSIINECNNMDTMIKETKELFKILLERNIKNGMCICESDYVFCESDYVYRKISEEEQQLLIDGLEEAARGKEYEPYMREKKLTSIKYCKW